MRIGIDLDDTICNTSEIVHKRIEEYANQLNLNPLDIMNDEYLKQDFFNHYLKDIYTNVEVKKGVVDVLKRIKSKGHKIYIITARNNNTSKKVKDVEKITKEWLDKHGIVVDVMITDAYGDSKASACKKHLIDLMIDDNPYNYKKVISTGTKCLLFDDRGRYDLGENYITTWQELEKYLEGMN